jgi:tRNA (adenine37-N6)-methyltransferase
VVRENEVRPGEIAVEAPSATDAGLVFIGVIHTPWASRLVTPRQGRADGPICRIEVFDPWREALDGIEQFERLEVLYWLHLSRRDLVKQSPANDGGTRHFLVAFAGPAQSDRHVDRYTCQRSKFNGAGTRP